MSRVLLNAGPSPRGWHRIENFMRCPTLSAITNPFQVIKGLTDAEKSALPSEWFAFQKRAEAEVSTSDPLARGSLGHVALCHYYARKGAQQPGGVYAEGNLYTDPDQLYEPEDAVVLAAREGGEVWESWIDPVLESFAAYKKRWEGEEKLFPRFVECVFWYRAANDPGDPDGTLPLGKGRYDVSYRVDLVAQGSDGLFYWIDHKSTGYMRGSGKSKAKFYSRSGQFIGYRLLGDRLNGKKFGGVVLNMFTISRSQDPAFARPPLQAVPERLARFPAHIVMAEDRLAHWIAQTRANGLSPLDWPAFPSEHQCETRYGSCPAANICDWGVE